MTKGQTSQNMSLGKSLSPKTPIKKLFVAIFVKGSLVAISEKEHFRGVIQRTALVATNVRERPYDGP